MIRASLSLACLTLTSFFVPAHAADTESPEKPRLTRDEATVLRLTNELRAKESLPPLKPNALLMEAARSHSANMAKQQKLAHVLDDKRPVDRVADTGYKHGYVGENVAGGSGLTPAAAFDLWVDSPPHKKNLLNDKYEEIGIGMIRDKTGQVYYTQVFASPKSGSSKKDDKSESVEFDKARAEILKLTNEARAKEKLPPLGLNPVLTRVANAHSANMAKQNKMAHVLDGKKPSTRVSDAGYDYAEVGENVAFGAETPVAEIFDAWMKSKLHRENILGADFQEIGIGIALATNGDVYYTQVFGTKRKGK